MAFLDSDGPLDKVGIIITLAFAANWYLAFFWGVAAARDFLPNWYNLFGLVDAGGDDVSFGSGHGVIGGATWVLPVFGLYLPAVLGTENSVGRHHRQFFGFWGWTSWTLFHFKFAFLNSDNDPFGGTPANYFWLANNLFFTWVHFKWVGSDLKHKFKLD